MKKSPVVVLLVAAAAIAAWRFAVPRQPEAPSLREFGPGGADRPSPPAGGHARESRQPSVSVQPAGPAARGLGFARIEDAAARDAALAAWAAEFTSNDAILALVAALRADPGSCVALRALIAPHLTRQWAAVDGAGCIAAYLREGGVFRRDPLDSNNNPFAAPDRDAAAPAANLFTLIAETNPAAFRAWMESAPADLIPSLLGDAACATWQAWRAEAGDGGKPVDGIDPIQAQNFHLGDFANAVAARDSDLLLRPALDGRDLGMGRRYYNGLLEKLGADKVFAATLLEARTPDQLWDIFGKMTGLAADFTGDPRAPFLTLAGLELAADSRSLDDAAAEAVNLPADYRQAAIFMALLDSLDPAAGDRYWDGINTIAKALNSTAAAVDGVKEITRVNLYSDLRARVATALARENLGEALAWTGSIADPRNRVSCLMRIAAQDLKPGVNAWASGDIGVADAAEPIVMHIEDTGVDPPLVRQFTLPAAPGESLPAYYARLHAAFKAELEGP